MNDKEVFASEKPRERIKITDTCISTSPKGSEGAHGKTNARKSVEKVERELEEVKTVNYKQS